MEPWKRRAMSNVSSQDSNSARWRSFEPSSRGLKRQGYGSSRSWFYQRPAGNPMLSSQIHLACWQRNFYGLRKLLKERYAHWLGAKWVETDLCKIDCVPGCLKATQGTCPHKAFSGKSRTSLARRLECLSLQDSCADWGQGFSKTNTGRELVAVTEGSRPEENLVSNRADHCFVESGSPVELAVRSGSLYCANLILAVLFVRKLLVLKLLNSHDPLIYRLWKSDPHEVLLGAVEKLREDAYNFVQSFGKFPPTTRTYVMACLLQQGHAVSGLTLPPLQARTRYLVEGLLATVLASAILSGERQVVRGLSKWTPLTKSVFARACHQVVLLNRTLYVTSTSRMRTTLQNLLQPEWSDDALVMFLMTIKFILKHACDLENFPLQSKRQSCKRSLEATARIFCTELDFLFDASRIPQRPVIHPRRRIHCCQDFLMIWKARSSLPTAFQDQCQIILRDMCRGGYAGWFLNALEYSHTLLQFGPLLRQRLVLGLLQYIRTTQPFHGTVFQGCRLCEKPILSFLVWLARQPPEILPDLSLEEVSWYCRQPDIALLRLMLQSPRRVRLCHHHQREVAGTMSACSFCVFKIVQHYRKTQTLQSKALLAVLDGMNGNCESLKVSALPIGLRRYFYLEKDTEAGEDLFQETR